MLVLFDNGTQRSLARYLIEHHAVAEARARGRQDLENGNLLKQAEAAGFEVLVTTTKTSVISRTYRAGRLRLPYSAKAAGRSSSLIWRRSFPQ